ncbi:SPOR domain-containing protein [Paracoccus sp. R86501]|uniref:SPOR domain-containing protein n=1 Tax=Paracoccus sp. R86501 TaxID=3101711 RepID=UPI0036703727
MRFEHWLAAMMMTVGTAMAAPNPAPPGDFAGSQYIDGAGCVFRREGGVWSARTDGAGQPLCGFPPSIGQARSLSVPATPDAENLLMEQLTHQLRPGEWAADPAQPETRRPAEPARHPDPLQTTLTDALKVAPVVKQAASIKPADELCERLGYHAGDAAAPGAALGLCPGMQVKTPKAAQAKPAAVRTAPVEKTSPRAETARAASAIVARRPAPAKPPKPMAEMIPASARYIQVGAFQDGENALIVLRALSGRGYPVAQTRMTEKAKGMRVIMAGPFPDRQKLVEALSELRRTGYAGAMPR